MCATHPLHQQQDCSSRGAICAENGKQILSVTPINPSLFSKLSSGGASGLRVLKAQRSNVGCDVRGERMKVGDTEINLLAENMLADAKVMESCQVAFHCAQILRPTQ